MTALQEFDSGVKHKCITSPFRIKADEEFRSRYAPAEWRRTIIMGSSAQAQRQKNKQHKRSPQSNKPPNLAWYGLTQTNNMGCAKAKEKAQPSRWWPSGLIDLITHYAATHEEPITREEYDCVKEAHRKCQEKNPTHFVLTVDSTEPCSTRIICVQQSRYRWQKNLSTKQDSYFNIGAILHVGIDIVPLNTNPIRYDLNRKEFSPWLSMTQKSTILVCSLLQKIDGFLECAKCHILICNAATGENSHKIDLCGEVQSAYYDDSDQEILYVEYAHFLQLGSLRKYTLTSYSLPQLLRSMQWNKDRGVIFD